MQNNQLKQLIDTSSRIILKVGSSLLINENNNDINYHWLKNFSKEIQSLTDKKKQIMIVSSGSVALGRKQLNLVKNLSLDEKQAAAAVGQIHLSHAWKEVLKSFNLESAQILLAPDDTETRRKHLNARATLLKLLQLNVIPVINENDTVSTDEIKFGDNDRLAARVAQMCEVDLLILFSDVNGLFSEDPNKNKNSELIKEITNGKCDNAISQLINNVHYGTLFKANKKSQNARKMWISSALQVKGKIFIDEGAEKAVKSGKSILPAGILKTEGSYNKGDLIYIVNSENKIIGKGLSHYNNNEVNLVKKMRSDKIEKVLGYRGKDEIIHIDDFVLEN